MISETFPMSNEQSDSVKNFFNSLVADTSPTNQSSPPMDKPCPSAGSQSPQDDVDQHNSTDSSSNANNSVENLFRMGNIPHLHPELGLRPEFSLGINDLFQSFYRHSGLLENDDQTRNSSNRSAAEPEDLSLRERSRNENDDGNSGTANNWTFEEQFKQLYELSDDKKRKDWLDDWFTFMHQRGKPVTRIPIMAKQVLDLYELYRLVVQHGGLVEIINKKLWREITKGLNLPSSITSAAFTLRTQYQKYLYEYECEKEHLSLPADLQAAIEGNKREGRRNTNINGSGSSSGFVSSRPNLGSAVNFSNPWAAAALFSKQFSSLMSPDEANFNALNSSYRDQLNGLDAQQRQMDLFHRLAEAMTKPNGANGGPSGRDSTCSDGDSDHTPAKKQCMSPFGISRPKSESPVPKTSLDKLLKNSHSAQFNIRTDRLPSGEKSLVVSMEINGIPYQGVLFPATSQNSEESLKPEAVDSLFGHNKNETRDWPED